MKEVWKNIPRRELSLQHPPNFTGRSDDSWEKPQGKRLGHLHVKVTQLALTPCNPIDYTIHGILQARILEWVAFPFSRGSSCHASVCSLVLCLVTTKNWSDRH